MNDLAQLLDTVQHSAARIFLETLPDESINSIVTSVTSPPYFEQRDYGDTSEEPCRYALAISLCAPKRWLDLAV